MAKLLARAFSFIFLMGLVAIGINARHPVGAASAPETVLAPDSAPANPWAANSAPASETPGAPRQPRVLSRDRMGQFRLDGFVNSRQTRFLVDTGADLVALPLAEAERLGVMVRDEDFRPMLRTASGTADGAPVVLDRLDVAGTTLTHVPAVVVRGLDENLLGQSALKQLGRVTLRGDAMVIDPG